MATISTTGLYEFDPYGNNPNNLITNEQQPLQVPGPHDFYFIIPKAAPFYVATMVVKSSTGQEYVEGVDYLFGHYFIEAVHQTGRAIAGSIRFLRRDITGIVELTYQTVGGQWGYDDNAVLQELSNKLVNPLRRSWDEIDPSPVAFPPVPHDQRVDELIGWQEVVDEVRNIADALQSNSGGVLDDHIANKENPHVVTQAQVGLGNVDNFDTAGDLEGIAGTRSDLFMTPRATRLAIAKQAVEALADHVDKTDNPHQVTKAQVGLPNVPNYPAASYAEASLMAAKDRLVTPYVLRGALDKYFQEEVKDSIVVTKEQIGLGNVDNYKTATIVEMQNGELNDRFATPVGVYRAITHFVGDRFDGHIDDFTNPHKVTAAQVGAPTTQEMGQALLGKLDKTAQAADALKVYGMDKDALIAEMASASTASDSKLLEGNSLEDVTSLSVSKLLTIEYLSQYPLGTYVKLFVRDYGPTTSNNPLPLQFTYIQDIEVPATAVLSLAGGISQPVTLVTSDHLDFPLEIYTKIEADETMSVWCKVVAKSQVLAIHRLVLDKDNNITRPAGTVAENTTTTLPAGAVLATVMDPISDTLITSFDAATAQLT